MTKKKKPTPAGAAGGTCAAPGCTASPTVARGLCMRHYQQTRRGSIPTYEKSPPGEGTQITLRAPTRDVEAWERAAAREEKKFRDWMRETLNKEAGK